MTQMQCRVSSEKENLLGNRSIILEENKNAVVSPLEKTDHTAQYNDFFTQILEKNVKLKIDSCLSALKKGGIIYDPNNFYQFTFAISKSVTVNLQIIKAEIKWGYFTMNVSILNNFSESYFHYCQSRQGSFGKVFFLDHPTQSFVIKCISLDWKLKKSETIKRNAVKEFFISKICSALECGSKMVNFIGFDLIFSNSCIEFAMEKCYPLRNQSAIIYQQMKMNLYLLHYFRIIHFDIKLDNIMFSRLHEKYVFIDFGLSDMLKEQMGWKYLLSFKGTPDFCSPQMTIAFGNQFKSFIDPYYNDIYCLRGSFISIKDKFGQDYFNQEAISAFYGIDLIKSFQSRVNLPNNDTDFEYKAKVKYIFSFIAVLKFKYSLSIQNKFPDQQMKKWNDLIIIFIYREIVKFINQAFNIKILRRCYKEIIPRLTKQSMQFQWLKQKMKPSFLNRDLKKSFPHQEKQKIINYYEGIDTKNKINEFVIIRFPDKYTIFQRIFDVNTNLQTQMRFFLFLQYVNFTNNTCNVKNQERIQLVRKFNSFNFQEQILENRILDQSVLNCNIFSFQELLNAFNTILSWYSSNQYDHQQQGKKIEPKIDVIFDIIEHMFFLNLIPTQALLLQLHNIYQYAFFTPYHKLQFILKIKHFNQWIIFLPHQKVIISHQSVQQFWREKFDQFKAQLAQPALKTIYNIFLESKMPCLQEINKLFNDQYYNKIPQSLKFQFGFEYYKQSFYITDVDQSSDLFQYLFSILPVQLKSKSFFFYNQVFLNLVNTEGENIDILREIHQIFEKNLNSSILTSELITYKVLRIIQASHQQKTKYLLPITQIINQNNLYFFDQLIIYMLNQYKNNKQWAPVQQSLRNFYSRVNFKDILSTIPAVCFKKILTYDYFIFKYQCSKMDTTLLNSYIQEMEEFQIYKNSQTCNLCKYVYLSTYFQLTINSYIVLDNCWLARMFNEFLNIERFFNINSSILQDKDFTYIRYNNYFQIISAYIKLEIFRAEVFLIAKDLFNIVKQNGDIFMYFDFLQRSPNLVYITIVMLHKNYQQKSKEPQDSLKSLAFKELIGLLKSLLNINTIRFIATYLNFLTLVFQKYITYSLENDSQILKTVLEQIEKQQQNGTIYSNVFYFAYVLRADHKERQKYLLKIYLWWDYLSNKMLLFYQFNLYCLLLYRFPQYLSKNQISFKDSEESQPSALSNRKRVYEQKKLLKIFTKMETINTKQKYKISTKFGLKIRKLYQKCSKYGGPYIANQHRLQLALIPSKRRKC